MKRQRTIQENKQKFIQKDLYAFLTFEKMSEHNKSVQNIHFLLDLYKYIPVQKATLNSHY